MNLLEISDITSSTAHKIAKPLLNANLKEGDDWYAVSKKWYTHFLHFGYFDSKEEDIQQEGRDYPAMMNNSELRAINNTYELREDLNENQHFVWINNKLYEYFIQWFGIEDGSLTFKREVINIGNETNNELMIEMHPIFVCCVECNQNGNENMSTKRIIPISRHDNVNKLMKKFTNIDNSNALLSLDDDEKIVRVWKKNKIVTKSKENKKSKEGEWEPFERDDEDDENDENDVAPPPSYEEATATELKKEEEEYEYDLLNDNECCVAFGEWALNIDLSSEIHYMFEIKTETGKWKREYDANKWRETIYVGLRIDIYDSAYHKWYSGEIIEYKKEEQQVLVHYDGYSSNYDEYLDKYCQRIEQLNTHTSVVAIDNYNNNNSYNTFWGGSYNIDDTTPPIDNGCVGLRNLGNTCFMNSTIQCLCHCPLFINYFLQNDYASEINRDNPLGWNGKVAETWSKLLKKYWSNKYSVLSPNNLKSTIGEIQPRFIGYQQHDSSELLQFLLDGLHEDLNRVKKKPYTEKIAYNINNDANQVLNDFASKSWTIHKRRNDSIIVDLIQGQLKSRVQCPDCNKISVTFDPFMFLSVPIPTEKKYITKIITVIHLDLNILPKTYAIKLIQRSSISQLKDELSLITKIAKDRLIITDIWSNHIYNIYKNYGSIDEISDHNQNNTFAYETPTDDEINQLLFNNKLSKHTKYKIIPIYHQIRKETKYFNSINITNKDIGIPLVIKLPTQYEIQTSLIKEYIEKIISPYLQNINKWIPLKKIQVQQDDEDEDEEEPQKKFGFDSSSEEQEEEEEEEEQEAKEIIDAECEPFTFVILDKYGKSCGQCSYSSYCSGCNLDNLSLSSLIIPDSTYDTRAFGIRWEIGTQNCFNHNAFLSPLHDKSVPNQSINNNNNNNYYSTASQQQHLNLSQCIDEFVAEETLSKNDAWYCRDCKDHKCAKKKLDLYSLPNICIIHLKRFTQNGYYREKNNASVKYPINGLDLSKWIATQNNNNNNNLLYDLFAVSIHSGGLGGGHYIAYAKNLNNNKWYEFDDSCVSSINENDAYTKSAYVLFYNKRDIKKEKPILPDNIDKSHKTDKHKSD